MSFLYPAFLFALSAIAIPIILHLVQLRRAKRIAFSNVKFIKASQDVTASQRKIKDLLILLSRILFVIFLVLAFAQPFIPAQEEKGTTDNGSVALVIDNSFSMQNRSAGADYSLLDAAIEKSNTLLNLFPATTGFYVYSNSGNLNKGFSTTSQDALSLASQLDYSAQNISLPRQNNFSHLFLLSDMQRSQFKGNLLTQLDSMTQVHVIPVSASGHENVFVDSLYLEDAFLRAGNENVLNVRIYNAGENEVADCPVKLFINNQQVAALSLDLPPKKATLASVSFRLDQSQASLASIYLEDYPVEFDNSYYFVLAPSSGVDIVEIAENNDPLLQQVYKGEPLLRLSSFTTGNLDYAKASSSDVIILNGLKTVSSGIATTISNFIKAGGTLLVIPAAESEPSSYASLFKSLGISGQVINNPSSNKTALIPPDKDNPFFRSIFSDYDQSMQMPAAVRNLSWDRASDDILKYRGGASFLSRYDKDKGQVYIMAAPLQEQPNSLINHALFVPVMYKLAITGYKQEQHLAYALDANTIRIPVNSTSRKEGVYKLENDSLSFIPDQQVRGGYLYFTIPPELNEAGFYKVVDQDSTLTTLAFNYTNNESLLEQYTPDELKALIGNEYKNIHVYEYGDAFSVKNEFEKRFFGVKLWKYCLILCLVFLMAEIALIRFL